MTPAQYQIRYARLLPGGEQAAWINCPNERMYHDALATRLYEGRVLYELPKELIDRDGRMPSFPVENRK
jgi:hypothetical protein